MNFLERSTQNHNTFRIHLQISHSFSFPNYFIFYILSVCSFFSFLFSALDVSVDEAPTTSMAPSTRQVRRQTFDPATLPHSTTTSSLLASGSKKAIINNNTRRQTISAIPSCNVEGDRAAVADESVDEPVNESVVDQSVDAHDNTHDEEEEEEEEQEGQEQEVEASEIVVEEGDAMSESNASILVNASVASKRSYSARSPRKSTSSVDISLGNISARSAALSVSSSSRSFGSGTAGRAGATTPSSRRMTADPTDLGKTLLCLCILKKTMHYNMHIYMYTLHLYVCMYIYTFCYLPTSHLTKLYVCIYLFI